MMALDSGISADLVFFVKVFHRARIGNELLLLAEQSPKNCIAAKEVEMIASYRGFGSRMASQRESASLRRLASLPLEGNTSSAEYSHMHVRKGVRPFVVRMRGQADIKRHDCT